MGICLNMIVRNESANLPLLFSTLPGQVDYFVIADTGSTDNTPEIIGALSDKYGIPGKVTRHVWSDFATNRNLALEDVLAARRAGAHDCDRIMILDADEELRVTQPGWKDQLQPGFSYSAMSRGQRLSVSRLFLLWLPDMQWEWKGRVHNYVSGGNPCKLAHLDGLHIQMHLFRGAKSSAFSDPISKASADAAIMAHELEGLPPVKNLAHRYFQWAHVLFLSGSTKKAAEIFEMLASRFDTGKGIRYASAVLAGRCGLSAGADLQIGHHWFDLAYSIDPNRREALFYKALAMASTDKTSGLALLDAASRLEMPTGPIFYLEHDLYEWRTTHQRVLLLAGSGDLKTAVREAKLLLSNASVPETEQGFLRSIVNRGGAIFD